MLAVGRWSALALARGWCLGLDVYQVAYAPREMHCRPDDSRANGALCRFWADSDLWILAAELVEIVNESPREP